MDQPAAPIIIIDPDQAEARHIADWLRTAGLGMITTVRTCDEAILMLGRRRASLLIVDERVPHAGERRLLRHVAARGPAEAPALVRLVCEHSADPLAFGRTMAAEVIQKPVTAHEVVVSVGSALQRPDLLGRMDRDRDQTADHLTAAKRMQQGLLPSEDQIAALQANCAVGLAGFCHPGEAVGGDFWGAWQTGRGRFALALADFAGHGLSAALNTFRLHAIMADRSLPHGAPVRMTTLLNQRLHTLLPRGHYATMIYAQIDPRTHRIAWCSAGGPPPLFVSAAGCVDLGGRGLPLGVKSAAIYAGNRMRLPGPGILCLFSDGLYESGVGAADVPRDAVAEALALAAALAARGCLTEAATEATARLQQLRDRYVCVDHSDDVMAVCVAVGPAAD